MTTVPRERRGSSSSTSSTLCRDDRRTTSSHNAPLPPAVADLCRLRQEWRQTTTIKTFWDYLRVEATEELKQVISKHPEKEDPMFRRHPELFLVSDSDRSTYRQLSEQLAKRKNSKRSSSHDDKQQRASKRTKRSSSSKTVAKEFDILSSQRHRAETRPSSLLPNEQQHALYSLINLYRETLMQQPNSPASIMGSLPSSANHRSAVTFVRSGPYALHRLQPKTFSRSTLVRTHS